MRRVCDECGAVGNGGHRCPAAGGRRLCRACHRKAIIARCRVVVPAVGASVVETVSLADPAPVGVVVRPGANEDVVWVRWPGEYRLRGHLAWTLREVPAAGEMAGRG